MRNSETTTESLYQTCSDLLIDESRRALEEKKHVQQFLGCTSWIRFYLPTVYPVMIKMISQTNTTLTQKKKVKVTRTTTSKETKENPKESE